MVGAGAGALCAHVDFLSVGASASQRLALYRCVMTIVIETMSRSDDSGSGFAEAFADFETAYLHLAMDFLEEPVVLRDVIELAIWEGYGLVRNVETFLTNLPEHHADAAMRHLSRVIAELRREGLQFELERATRLRRAVLASLDSRSERPADDERAPTFPTELQDACALALKDRSA